MTLPAIKTCHLFEPIEDFELGPCTTCSYGPCPVNLSVYPFQQKHSLRVALIDADQPEWKRREGLINWLIVGAFVLAISIGSVGLDFIYEWIKL